MSQRGSQLVPDKNRLRWILITFFLALAVPTAVLVYKSLDQLKWQAVHQYRGLASELAARIDADLNRRARREANRLLADYSFFSVTRSQTTNYQSRSPLATFPVVAELPGTIGYFQVDTNGEFSSPLLPVNREDQIGIAPPELILRQRLRNEILQILSDNELVTPASPAQLRDRTQDFQPSPPSPVRRELTEKKQKESSGSRVTTSTLEESTDARSAAESESAATTGAAAKSAQPDSKRAAADSDDKSNTISKTNRILSKRQQARSSNFDRLSPDSASQSIGVSKNRGALRKLDELNLDQSLRQRAVRRDNVGQSEAMMAPPKPSSIAARPSAEPAIAENLSAAAKASAQLAESDTSGVLVTTFESDVDPFAFSRLNSGHFVLYRKAWRNGQRLIQGLLIDSDRFVRELIRPGFSSSSMAPISDLTVAFGGSVLTTLSGLTDRSYQSSSRVLSGSVLYESALSEPFNNLRLVFSVKQLPTNAGTNLITWMAILLTTILGAGLYGLYRLGKRRLELASQQQDFVAAVSHELKTPLTSIRMYGEMLREGWASEEKKATYYDFIHDESERLSRLIDNVLQLARMNRDDIPVNLQPVNPSEALDMIRSRTAATISRAGFTCSIKDMTRSDVSNSPSQQKVLMDPDLFVQVMINLIDNALKFSNKAGKRHLDICVTASDHSVSFLVRDYGPGIAEDQIRKIFRLFYRAETELTRETVGTGIGLALVSQLVRAMGGKVDVVNKTPGAQFQVVLPRA